MSQKHKITSNNNSFKILKNNITKTIRTAFSFRTHFIIVMQIFFSVSTIFRTCSTQNYWNNQFSIWTTPIKPEPLPEPFQKTNKKHTHRTRSNKLPKPTSPTGALRRARTRTRQPSTPKPSTVALERARSSASGCCVVREGCGRACERRGPRVQTGAATGTRD